jgi:hypothetical protein
MADLLIPPFAVSPIDKIKKDVDIYGQSLTGNETELELYKLRRIQEFNVQMRANISGSIGDTEAKLTDVIRMVVIGSGIQLGLITAPWAINTYKYYIETMLPGMGGVGPILGTLNEDLSVLGEWLIGRFYVARTAIRAASTKEQVDAVTL